MARNWIKWFDNVQAGYTDRYKFDYREQTDGSIAPYSLVYPSDPRNTSASKGHLLSGGKLCIREGHEFYDLEEAVAYTHWWMKRWSIYVRTGEFPMTAESIEV